MRTLSTVFFSAIAALTLNSQNTIGYLDANNVRACISNRGYIHYNPNTQSSFNEVPIGSGRHSSALTSLWIAGYDTGGQLHMAAQRDPFLGNDFWPGPLDTLTGSITTATSVQYDKIWKVNQSDINAFLVNFSNGLVQSGQYVPTNDILTWPAHGSGGQARNLAPFVDVNGNGIYDPIHDGDYPKIKGTQMLFWIYNDNLVHTNTGAQPLKVEIHASAYAYGTPGQASYLNNATYYDFKIFNRSQNHY